MEGLLLMWQAKAQMGNEELRLGADRPPLRIGGWEARWVSCTKWGWGGRLMLVADNSVYQSLWYVWGPERMPSPANPAQVYRRIKVSFYLINIYTLCSFPGSVLGSGDWVEWAKVIFGPWAIILLIPTLEHLRYHWDIPLGARGLVSVPLYPSGTNWAASGQMRGGSD